MRLFGGRFVDTRSRADDLEELSRNETGARPCWQFHADGIPALVRADPFWKWRPIVENLDLCGGNFPGLRRRRAKHNLRLPVRLGEYLGTRPEANSVTFHEKLVVTACPLVDGVRVALVTSEGRDGETRDMYAENDSSGILDDPRRFRTKSSAGAVESHNAVELVRPRALLGRRRDRISRHHWRRQ